MRASNEMWPSYDHQSHSIVSLSWWDIHVVNPMTICIFAFYLQLKSITLEVDLYGLLIRVISTRKLRSQNWQHRSFSSLSAVCISVLDSYKAWELIEQLICFWWASAYVRIPVSLLCYNSIPSEKRVVNEYFSHPAYLVISRLYKGISPFHSFDDTSSWYRMIWIEYAVTRGILMRTSLNIA